MRSAMLRTVLQSDPYQVQNLTATPVSGTQIDLDWDDVAALSGETYDIERDGGVIVTGHSSTSYSDTTLSPATEYTYRVRATKTV